MINISQSNQQKFSQEQYKESKMGRTINDQQLRINYRLTCSYRNDNISHDQRSQQIHQINQRMTEMVNVMEELSHHLRDYLRIISQQARNLNQLLRQSQNSESSLEQAHYNQIQLIDLQNQIAELERQANQDVIGFMNELQSLDSESYSRALQILQGQLQNLESQSNASINIPINVFPDRSPKIQQSFLSRAYNYCAGGIRSFVELVAFTS